MRTLTYTSLAFLAMACGAEPEPAAPVDADTGKDAAADSDTDPEGLKPDDTFGVAETDTDTDPPLAITFTSEKWRATELAISQKGNGIDLDGDGDIDNKVGELFEQIGPLLSNAFPGSYSLAAINANVAYALASDAVIVLMRGHYDESTRAFTLAVHDGEESDTGAKIQAKPSTYDTAGKPVQVLNGKFTSLTEVSTGPDALSLPIQFDPNEPIITVRADKLLARGEITPTKISGFLAGAIPVSVILDEIAYPLIDSYSSGDQTVLKNTLKGLLEGAASNGNDLDVDFCSEPCLSAAFRFSATVTPWDEPPGVPAP